ncbi:MAG: ASKHA domain-containing protein [Clostridiales bacterium]|nr:ASKHA domain-containing protein [Clostridiales bacterium]
MKSFKSGKCGDCVSCGKCGAPKDQGALRRKEEISATMRGFCVDNKYEKRLEGDAREKCFGLSFDVGTTTVVGMLWNMVSGELLGVKAEANPQAAHGADVISRIVFAGERDGNLHVLQSEITGCMNRIAGILTENLEIRREDVFDAVACGNTTMSHLLLGSCPSGLARAPFAPAFRGAVSRRAMDLGLEINPEANMALLPNIAGHVGSDVTSGLIASGIMHKDGVHLLIDIGTNGEIVLCADGKAAACSTAAGPAFEGASVRQGMRAATGAIERVDIGTGSVDVGVIGGCKPLGICGSGLMDAVSELFRAGLMDRTGRLLTAEAALGKGVAPAVASRLTERKTSREFLLVHDGAFGSVAVTQKDIREVQLAKAAMRAGIQLMLKDFGLTEADIQHIYIAGAFGSHIRTESAVRIGLIPDIGKERVLHIGNAAGAGAGKALLSVAARYEAEQTADGVRHTELAMDPLFQEVYLGAMAF